MTSGWQTLLAPAKLTLSLHIVGTRPDGYHLIEAEMVSLDLADELEIRASPENLLSVSSSETGLKVPSGSDNLVIRALNLAQKTAEVRLSKKIPSGAGLGGGSADAAAILRWAGYSDLIGAAGLGADVAFCLVGGCAQVSGIGEQIEPLARDSLSVTLLTPPFGVSTPDVYKAWDDLGGPSHSHNDLTSAALAVEPRLGQWRDAFADATKQNPILAGSGGTWFVEGTHHALSVMGVNATIAVTANTSAS